MDLLDEITEPGSGAAPQRQPCQAPDLQNDAFSSDEGKPSPRDKPGVNSASSQGLNPVLNPAAVGVWEERDGNKP